MPDENYDPYIMIDVGGALERVNAKGALERESSPASSCHSPLSFGGDI